MKDAKNFTGYLEFAFSQGFENSEINEVVKKENHAIQKTVEATVKNPTDKEKKYQATFDLIKVNAVASTGGVVAMFSANESIEFTGFKEIAG